MSPSGSGLLGELEKDWTVLKVVARGLNFAFRLKWFVEHMPSLSQKERRESEPPVWV